MKIQLISDLHLDCQTNRKVEEFYTDLERIAYKADVLVVAGDIAEIGSSQYFIFLNKITDLYTNIFLVFGNHEYYRQTKVSAHTKYCQYLTSLGVEKASKLHLLENTSYALNGITFAGSTLWFKDDPFNVIYENGINDFCYIYDLKDWIYKSATDSKNYLESVEADIIITHHLPTYEAVEHRYKGDPFNRFFVHQLDKFNAKLYLFGHSHYSVDFENNSTRFVSNPLGYRNEYTAFNPSLIIEI